MLFAGCCASHMNFLWNYFGLNIVNATGCAINVLLCTRGE